MRHNKKTSHSTFYVGTVKGAVITKPFLSFRRAFSTIFACIGVVLYNRLLGLLAIFAFAEGTKRVVQVEDLQLHGQPVGNVIDNVPTLLKS